MSKKLLILALVFLLVASTTAYATAYLTPNGDNVDSGGHLDWDSNTKYLSDCNTAQSVWNGYKSGVIRKDSFWVIEDIFVSDYYDSTETRFAYRRQSNSTINFNDYYFVLGNSQSLTAEQRTKTVIHEFGHALGLGHNTSSNPAIMRQGRFEYKTLHQDDKDSFDEAEKAY